VVQISALGADAAAQSRFQGSSARLFMLLAALPVTPLPGDGRQRVQPIHIEDLTELVVNLLRSPGRRTVEAVGPRAITLREWLCLLRAQLGLGPARDPREFVTPAQSGGLALRAKLDWLRPLLRHSIGLLWIVSGVLSLGLFPVEQSLAMLGRVGLTGTLASVALYGAAALDIALGLATITMKTAWLWRVQIALVLGYTALITLYLPELWLHPFGPVLKNLPILAALVALHELEERR
jgi:hypothetical protein